MPEDYSGAEFRLKGGVKDLGTTFTLDPIFLHTFRELPYSFGYPDSQFGEIVFYRTYSRIKPDGTQEDWYDTIQRVIEGVMTIRKWWFEVHQLPWDDARMQRRAQRMAVTALQMRWLPAGRSLWSMGTDYVYERGSVSLWNCAAVSFHDVPKVAELFMNFLMSGIGAAFDYGKQQSPFLPDLERTDWYVIPDTREGWSYSIRRLLESYFRPDAPTVQFDYSQLRPRGAPIRGFGGTASGPSPLQLLHERTRLHCENYYHGKSNWTMFITDLANCIGDCVVAGNVRRSAELAMGSPRDDTFLDLKDYDKYPERVTWGHLSNNACYMETKEDFARIPAIVERLKRRGEPGFYNAVNVHRYARYGDMSYGEDKANLCNPCGEIPLETSGPGEEVGGELCCLSEVYPLRCRSKKEFLEAVEDATFFCSTVVLYPTFSSGTNTIIARNRRIGVSLSGVADWADKYTLTKVIRWMKDGYRAVREENALLANEAGVPCSIRVTTSQPSGTKSQLVGCSPGVHFNLYRYALRRIRIAADSPLTPLLIAANYPFEPQLDILPLHEARGRTLFEKYWSYCPSNDLVPVQTLTTLVFEVPIHNPDCARAQDEICIWEQLALGATVQREWADNSVSQTITFKPETEADQLEQAIAQFIPVLKTMSFLPQTKDVYAQAPYEKLTKEEYDARIRVLMPIDWAAFRGSDGQDERYCTSDKCEISPQ